jgi:DNA-binding response OmpR family regulator
MPHRGVILLAEDREDDVLLVKRAFSRAHIINPICVVRDGEEAIFYLDGEGKYSDRAQYPIPSLLLLDLKMPIKNGFEVIKWARRKPYLQFMRILVLTSSDSLKDVNLAYKLGANSFLVKPLDFENCAELGASIREWLGGNGSRESDHVHWPSRESDKIARAGWLNTDANIEATQSDH